MTEVINVVICIIIISITMYIMSKCKEKYTGAIVSGNYYFDDVVSPRKDLDKYWKWKTINPSCKSYRNCYL